MKRYNSNKNVNKPAKNETPSSGFNKSKTLTSSEMVKPKGSNEVKSKYLDWLNDKSKLRGSAKAKPLQTEEAKLVVNTSKPALKLMEKEREK